MENHHFEVRQIFPWIFAGLLHPFTIKTVLLWMFINNMFPPSLGFPPQSTMVFTSRPFFWLVVWLPSILFSQKNSGFRLSSQLTNSYFSEGWPNHQPVFHGGIDPIPVITQVLIPTWFGFAIAGMIMFGRRMQVPFGENLCWRNIRVENVWAKLEH